MPSNLPTSHNVGSLRSSRVVERDYGPSFGVGDVIGCGWNIKTSTVWFTKNGEWLGNGFEKVAGRFYPCIWIGIGEVQLSVNFGQHPFAYNFAKLLPPEFLSSLTDMEKTTKGMGVAEIRRRTQAEELKVMVCTDDHPQHLLHLDGHIPSRIMHHRP